MKIANWCENCNKSRSLSLSIMEIYCEGVHIVLATITPFNEKRKATLPVYVVVVDSDPRFLEIATRFLQKREGTLVYSAVSTGDEVLKQTDVFEPDVILYNLGNSNILIKKCYIHNNSLGAYTDIDGGVWQEATDDHPVFKFEKNRMENNGPDRVPENN